MKDLLNPAELDKTPRNQPEWPEEEPTKATLAKQPKHEGSQAPDEGQTQNNKLSSPQEVLLTFTSAGGQLSSSRFVSTHQDLAWWNSCQLQQSSAMDTSNTRSL